MNRYARLLFALCFLTLATFSAPSQAQYACVASTSGSMNFLVYNPASGTPAAASVTATLTCTYLGGGAQKIAWAMELSNGRSGDCNGRSMPGPSGNLSYNVYINSIGGGIWGNLGCASFPSGQITVNGGAGNRVRTATNTLYGQIPVGQYVAVGTYTENLTLTISY
jgi:spore coat protein U-like protein